MSGHTPGPWVLVHDPIREVYNLGWDGEGDKIAEQRAANIRLIEAAPELLAACEWALAVMEYGRGSVSGDEDTVGIDDLRALIARVRGE